MSEFAYKVLTSPIGKTYLFSLGQAGYIIKSKTGQLLGIDLYLSECVERIEGHVGFKRLLPKLLFPFELEFDCLIATHSHFDHFDMDAVPQLMSNGKTMLFASVRCEEEVKRLRMEQENIVYVKPGDQYQSGDFLLEFVDCDHGESAPDAVGIIIQVDGKTIYETGDTCLRLDKWKKHKKGCLIDVMIAPINGAFGNMDEQDCASLSEALGPGITIPCHYGMFASHGGDPGKFLAIMEERCPGNKVLIMSQGERLALD